MDKGKWWIVLVLVVLAVLDLNPFLWASDKIWMPSLHGLREVYVEVGPLDPGIEKAGLTGKQLQTIAEQELHKAGIKVLSDEQREKTRETAILSVEINTEKQGSSTGMYDYHVLVLYYQTVLLERDPEIRTLAATWISGGELGSAFDQDGFSSIKNSVRQQVDEFLLAVLNSYLSVKSE